MNLREVFAKKRAQKNLRATKRTPNLDFLVEKLENRQLLTGLPAEVTFREGGGSGFVDSQIHNTHLRENPIGDSNRVYMSDRNNFYDAGLFGVENLFDVINLLFKRSFSRAN